VPPRAAPLTPTNRNAKQIHALLLVSRQGRVRLAKYYNSYSELSKKQKGTVERELKQLVLDEASSSTAQTTTKDQCNFLHYKGLKLVYRRYASLFFLALTDEHDNPLLALEIIHHYVEALDRYFGNVCELDIIFNAHKAYFLLDETLMAGVVQETSKREILRATQAQDQVMAEESAGERSFTLGGVTVVVGGGGGGGKAAAGQ